MRLYLRHSKTLLALLLVTHLAAMLLLILSRVDVVMTLPLLCIIGLQLGFYCRDYGWLDRKAAVTAVFIDADGRCAIVDHEQQKQAGFYIHRSVILGPLMVIYLRRAGQWLSRPVLIPRDATDREDWRKLCILLRNTVD
jgi:hypothetical protein